MLDTNTTTNTVNIVTAELLLSVIDQPCGIIIIVIVIVIVIVVDHY